MEKYILELENRKSLSTMTPNGHGQEPQDIKQGIKRIGLDFFQPNFPTFLDHQRSDLVANVTQGPPSVSEVFPGL